MLLRIKGHRTASDDVASPTPRCIESSNVAAVKDVERPLTALLPLQRSINFAAMTIEGAP